jgi:hypothetical protein
MMNIKTNLLKNLTAAFVIVFMVGVGGAWAQEVKSNLPLCSYVNTALWDNCYGSAKSYRNGMIEYEYEGEYKNGKKNGRGKIIYLLWEKKVKFISANF